MANSARKREIEGSVSRKFSAVQHPQAQRRHTQHKILHVSCVSRRGLSTRTHTNGQIDRYRYRYTRTLELLMHTNYYNDISSLSKTRESEKAEAATEVEAEAATHRGGNVMTVGCHWASTEATNPTATKTTATARRNHYNKKR